jgi:hypothetical protein
MEWQGKPEGLGYEYHDVVKVASEIIKTAVKQGPHIAAFANWFFTIGGTPREFSKAWKSNQLSNLINISDREPPYPKFPVKAK